MEGRKASKNGVDMLLRLTGWHSQCHSQQTVASTWHTCSGENSTPVIKYKNICVLIMEVYPSSFNDSTGHDYGGNTLLPNHSPEVRDGIIGWGCVGRRREGGTEGGRED